MAYADLDDIKDAAGGVDAFVDLFDWDGDGSASSGEDAARLARMQSEVEAWLESRLGTRYGVPLADPSGAFASLVADEVVFKARARRNMVTATHEDAHKERVAWVDQLATGKAVPSDPAPAPASTTRSAWVSRDSDPISRSSMRGFR